tara:strand:+ start:99 stop:242 length:144 start_codon:yes stop_codon:yes gene_type:complete
VELERFGVNDENCATRTLKIQQIETLLDSLPLDGICPVLHSHARSRE